ncbi:helix-turn-helix domain-containing protein [Jiulongibacter sediminis]|uniref:helix-turn-helix domain-containing protein n=1 Tax=Jiulongibacter sediminis TaxID=1605367 RepID=UPI0006DC5BA6|nr:helix-turn-helix domain-containing protein [Jiulongibacter sediminis]
MSEDALKRKLNPKELFQKGFLNNSLQYNVVVVNSDNNLALISNLNFKHDSVELTKNSQIEIQSDEPVLKLHFSLEGTYAYQPVRHIGFKVQIPENHCNIFYLPKSPGKEFYETQKSKAFEIFLRPEVLSQILGDKIGKTLPRLSEALNNNSAYQHWDKSKFIPPHIRNKIMDILLCPYQGRAWHKYVESSLTVLLIDFFLKRDPNKTLEKRVQIPNADYLALVNVENHIRQNLENSLRIPDLSEVAGFNATKLKRDFKKVYGVTIFKYITSIRMEQAIKLITEDGRSIAQAAYEVGFSHPQHFTTAFKRTMGYLPSQLKPSE